MPKRRRRTFRSNPLDVDYPLDIDYLLDVDSLPDVDYRPEFSGPATSRFSDSHRPGGIAIRQYSLAR